MEEIVQHAFDGDKQAQEYCTENNIIIPCPCCKGKGVYHKSEGAYFAWQLKIKCTNCGMSTAPAFFGNNGRIKYEQVSDEGITQAQHTVLRRWNTRTFKEKKG